MRSFRLDSDSVADFLLTWPTLAVGGILAGLLAYADFRYLDGRVGSILIGGTFAGMLLRDRFADRFKEQYPGAQRISLLSVGMMILLAGFGVKLCFRESPWSPLDMTWLGPAFLLILSFVIINRKNPHVMR